MYKKCIDDAQKILYNKGKAKEEFSWKIKHLAGEKDLIKLR